MTKNIIIIVLLCATLQYAQQQNVKTDTTFSKVEIVNNKNILIDALPYLVALVGIASTLITVFVTNRNQRKIAQSQLTANLITKWIDDVINEAAEIQTLFEKSYTFSIKKAGVKVFSDDDLNIFQTEVMQIELRAYKLGLYFSSKDEKEKGALDMISGLCKRLIEFRDLCDDVNRIQEISAEAELINKIIKDLEVELQNIVEMKRKFIYKIMSNPKKMWL